MTDEAERELKAFEREERFIVIKRKHLSEAQERDLREGMRLRGIGAVECVVVESDWPEYETVWQMIEDRVTGRTRPTDDLAVAVEHIREQITHAETRIQDGIEMGWAVWRIALEDIVRENRAALSKLTGGEQA